MTLAFWAVGIIITRSSYMPAEDCMTMLPLDEDGSGGGAAAEIVQTTLDHFGEPTIAGKTHSQILAMKRWNRCNWYKTILLEEREEAMRLVDITKREKLSAAWTPKRKEEWSKTITGENHPFFGKTHTDEANTKNREAHMGENNNFFGKTHTKEVRAKMSKPRSEEGRTNIRASWTPERRAKISAALTGRVFSEESKAKMSVAGRNKTFTEEHRAKLREVNSGENNPMYGRIGDKNPSWKGGMSFEPYCPAFNEQLKESIRNRDNRTCVLCGTGEIQNGQRLSVHHIDADKMQGCNGKNWYLCALCRVCNSRPDTIEKEFLIVTGGHGA